MYFITTKDTETGKKLQDVYDKGMKALDEQKSMAEKYGFKEWRSGYWCVWGRFSSVIFENEPDKNAWKKVKGSNEYMPKGSTKAGRVILEDFLKMSRVHFDELNNAVGYVNSYSSIGFTYNETHFGFELGNSWIYEPLKDCEEVTVSKYREMFK